MNKCFYSCVILVILCKLPFISCLNRAILASPLDEDIGQVLSCILDHENVKSIFTGISDIYAANEFQSMEGTPISNINLIWKSEPNNIQDSKTCLIMDRHKAVTTVSCSDSHPFICRRKEGVEKLNDCGTADLEYEFNNRTGSCYKVSQQKLPWSEGFKSCATDGGNLAVINSNAEAEEVWMLIRNLYPDGKALLGIRAWGEHRVWITIHGQSLIDAGYSHWYPWVPKKIKENEMCGSMYVGGHFEVGILVNVPCTDSHYFICEINSENNIMDTQSCQRNKKK